MGNIAASATSFEVTFGDHVVPLSLALALVVAGIFLSRYVTRFIRARLSGSSTGEVSIVVNLSRAVVAVIVIYFVGENVFGIEMSGIIQALGVTTLVVSLGLQDLIKNVVAGVQIVMTHLLSVGDHIEVNGARGQVMDVNWRQTIIRDKDGDPHVIPNQELMGGTFVRLDDKMARRYTLECDIKPGLDLDRVAADIERLADEALDEQGLRAEENSEVRFLGSTANGVIASVRIYLADIEYTTRGMDAVMRAIGQRGYLADWTNEAPTQEQWR